MKVLKYVFYLLLLLLVCFFLAGLIKPKVNYETTATVNQPLEQAWAQYNDMDKIQEWIPEVKNNETVKETESKIGSMYNITVNDKGKDVVMQEDVIAFKRNEELGLKFRTGNMIKTDLTRFKAVGKNTRITTQHEVEGSNYLTKCMFAFFGPMFKKIDQGYMNNFKSWAESIGPVEQTLADNTTETVENSKEKIEEKKTVKTEVKPNTNNNQVASSSNSTSLGYPSDCPHDQNK